MEPRWHEAIELCAPEVTVRPVPGRGVFYSSHSQLLGAGEELVKLDLTLKESQE